MSSKSGSVPILVISDDPAVRRRVESALDEHWPVRARASNRLTDRASLVDVQLAFVALSDSTDDGRVLEVFDALGELEALRAVVLLAASDGPHLAAAVERLDPVQVLPSSAPPWLLRLAVERALPGSPTGEGARAAHRPAPTLLGVSAAIRELLDQIERVATSRAPVLIRGETGTGKELVARALHERSDRARAGFVPVNCGALTETLLESELFGHVRGAFTGADRDRPGLVEEADGGTLFLDEVGEMTPSLQVKLLRTLETGEVRRVGDRHDRRVDVRVVSATHRDLDSDVASGRFRQDLYYRLNTVTLEVPPLRRRRVDIPFLAQHFAEMLGEQTARRITLDESFLDALSRHDFPGNVRELRNAVERAIALATSDDSVSADLLPRSFDPSHGVGVGVAETPGGTLRERVEHLERDAIREAEALCAGNRTRMARQLGLSRLGLRKKMRRLGLERMPADGSGDADA